LYGSQSLGCWVSPLPLTWPCFGGQCDNITNGCNPRCLPWCRPSCPSRINVYSHLRSSCALCAISLYLHEVVLSGPGATRRPAGQGEQPSTDTHASAEFTPRQLNGTRGLRFYKLHQGSTQQYLSPLWSCCMCDGAILVPTSADHDRSQTCSNRTVCARAASRLSPLVQYLYLP